MGMTITVCYVFLALILAPALVKSGLYPLAVHLFKNYFVFLRTILGISVVTVCFMGLRLILVLLIAGAINQRGTSYIPMTAG